MSVPPVEVSGLGRRIDGLAAAAEAARGLVDAPVLEPAVRLADRGTERLKLSGEHTIVALAGATGSGKSSLFNALTDMELAGTGVRRPTTSWALACAWGPDGAEHLLEWMGIPARHQVSRMSMLDRSADETRLDGLVLLDLPDHDSTEVSHHLEMDRLVQYSDLLVWVLDPQKYADAAIHERYIRPMAGLSDVTLVVLNQIDRIPYEQREDALADVRRLVEADGLPDAHVIGVSATRGDGLDDLRRELSSRIRDKSAARERLLADLAVATGALVAEGGDAPTPVITPAVRENLCDELADSAGVDRVGTAVRASTRRRTVARTGWPPARWVARLLRRRGDDPELQQFDASTLSEQVVPEVGPVQRADADVVVRRTLDDLGGALAAPWRRSLRSAVGDDVAGSLDRALTDVDLRVSAVPVWARLVLLVQWLLLLAAVVGVVGLVLDRTGSVDVPAGSLYLTVGALVAGIVLGLVARVVSGLTSRGRADRVRRVLRETVESVADEAVLRPIGTQLATYERYRAGITAARG